MTRCNVSVLGATGSIGDSALDVIARHPDRFTVTALTAHRQWEKLAELCVQHRPQLAALTDPAAARLLERALAGRGLPTRVLAGDEGQVAAASLAETDTVIAAIVGAAGLRSTLAAAAAGKRILLANKEALVIGGAVFMAAAAAGGAQLLPIDSEHNAIFQCLPASYARDPAAAGVRRILLTASGGPFRNRPLAELHSVTADEACAHPNWVMGRKISVDSATMMNKGLEVIEAHWLFGAPLEAIQVVVHPQSVIHSMVEYADGSVVAQLGAPDMRTPIACALAFPERIESGAAPLDFTTLGSLDFERLDAAKFPCVALAREAIRQGGTAPAALNAANEIAVEAFLGGRLSFTGIAEVIESVLGEVHVEPLESLEQVYAADIEARGLASRFIARRVPQSSLSV
jgi:1-deoxy-D-xylulose-5-phosphate reductoisomerase